MCIRDRNHGVLEREAGALLGLGERHGPREFAREILQADLGADETRDHLGTVLANDRDDPRLVLECEGREGDVDYDFAAVSAQEREIGTTAYRPRNRVPGILVAFGDVRFAVRGWHEHLDSLANELLARVASQDRNEFVHVADHAVVVDDDDPVGHDVEQLVPGKRTIFEVGHDVLTLVEEQDPPDR